MRVFKFIVLAIAGLGLVFANTVAQAKTVKIEISSEEVVLQVDNAGTKQKMWTFGGTIPGPLVRVTEGDVIDFVLTNGSKNKESHSIDFHAAVVDVLNEFGSIKPGETKKFQFQANHPGVFIYHCGSDAMVEHIARGMYGVIIVDPKGGYNANYPKPDREYVLVQGDLFEEGATVKELLNGEKWKGAMINGKVFHYDPVHDKNATKVLNSKPGELVRVFFVNANVHDPVAFHPIAGIWERVYANGNPRNVTYGMQTVEVPVASAATFDLVSPADHATNNALVDHAMVRALQGAITVLMNNNDAPADAGRNGNLIP
jgi:nitrite reductase (NO-forming)